MKYLLATAAVASTLMAANQATAEETQVCHSLTDTSARLECYDKATGFTQVNEKKTEVATEVEMPQTPSKWIVSTSTSDLDDTKNVILRMESDTDIRGKYGNPGPMTIFLRCMENTTSIYFIFNDHFMSDHQYGRVTYRLDDKKAAKKNMKESTDNKALGLWQGGSAIPFIKRMFGHETILVQATPHSESAVKSTFFIAGLEQEIKPLREACNW